jgi:hypothetical protein
VGTGLVIGGERVPVPGVDVQNYLDEPRLRLGVGDRRGRTAAESRWVHLLVYHTTAGIPGGADKRPQLVRPGLGPSTGGGQRVVASWTHDEGRPGGAHLVVDQDGSAYCCADLLVEAAYHAKVANGCSVGIEVVQGREHADLYQGQLEVAARLGLWVCRLMPVPIQWQVPYAYEGGPSARFAISMLRHPPLDDVVGIVGHRDLTTTRGEGDPGDAMMRALEDAGCERVDFSRGHDLIVWRERQVDLGMQVRTGVPSADTVAALRAAGHPDGVWRLPVA